jgi:hypothetical protein
MNNRFDDTNWGKYGNPYRREWYHTARTRRELPIQFHSDDSTGPDSIENTPHVSLWTIFLILAVLLILSGLSDTMRGIVFEGRDLADAWYSGVDSLLDALGAPKLP